MIRLNFSKTSLSQELSRLNYLKDETWFESRKFWVGHKSGALLCCPLGTGRGAVESLGLTLMYGSCTPSISPSLFSSLFWSALLFISFHSASLRLSALLLSSVATPPLGLLYSYFIPTSCAYFPNSTARLLGILLVTHVRGWDWVHRWNCPIYLSLSSRGVFRRILDRSSEVLILGLYEPTAVLERRVKSSVESTTRMCHRVGSAGQWNDRTRAERRLQPGTGRGLADFDTAGQDPGYMSRTNRKFRTDKFGACNKRKFRLMQLM